MRGIHLIGICFIFMLVGCSQDSMIKSMMTPEDEAVVRNYIELLKNDKLELIEKDLDPEIRNADMHSALSRMTSLIPKQYPDSIKMVGLSILNGDNFTSTNITYEYQFKDKWLLINIAVKKKDGIATITAFNVIPIQDSLENINRFNFVGKQPLHYAVLLLTVLVSAFSIYAFALCLGTNISRNMKLSWIIFIIFGFGKFSINWTTGEWLITVQAIQLFSGGAYAPAYGPWVISFSIPIGAIVFVLLRGRLRKSADKTPQSHPIDGDVPRDADHEKD